MNERLKQKLDEYRRDHQHPVNKAIHMIGIPMIVVSLPLMFFAPPVGVSLFVIGWTLQLIGHAFEGKPPSFLRDPKFLLMGLTWYVSRVFARFR